MTSCLSTDSDAAEKLLRKGKLPAEVADLLDLDPPAVGQLWQWIQLSDALEAAAPKGGKKRGDADEQAEQKSGSEAAEKLGRLDYQTKHQHD